MAKESPWKTTKNKRQTESQKSVKKLVHNEDNTIDQGKDGSENVRKLTARSSIKRKTKNTQIKVRKTTKKR